eukprot:2480135-Rhodomonas_salina.1
MMMMVSVSVCFCARADSPAGAGGQENCCCSSVKSMVSPLLWCHTDTLQPCPLNSSSEANSWLISACACNVGHYSGGSSWCVACAAGQFCAGGVLQSCPRESTLGALSGDASDCSCNAGYSGALCEACPAGSYKGTAGRAACTLVAANSFSW